MLVKLVNSRLYLVLVMMSVISLVELYCCLLPQCKALRTCRSGFPITTKWCCNEDVKVVLCASLYKKNVRLVLFVAKRRGCCSNHSAGIVLNALFATNRMCTKNNTRTRTRCEEQEQRVLPSNYR